MASRRRFIGATLAAAAGAAFDVLSASPVLAQAACGLEAPAGERLRTIPLEGISHRDTPFHTPVGGPGLDTRQFTDLSTLAPDRLITPTPQVFVRTAPPPQLPPALDAWSVSLQGHAGPRSLTIGDLRALSRPMGAHLVECAGNSDPDNFGLLSVAEWDGVPLDTLLPRLAPQPSDYGLLISGLDDETATPRSSTPGASWILPLADARAQRAFLATRMNGELLPREHGAPVRLVVPGWYGCAWIKWVTDVRLVDAGAPVTSQMAEFAARTHQRGEPLRARAYEPPVIDVAATPIRVEQWRVQGRTEYRVIGIVWGGDATPGELAIRFGARDAWRRVSVCRSALAPGAWSLWAYTWRPEAPGTYDIALSCPDTRVRTRRLDLFYYVRRVRIDDV